MPILASTLAIKTTMHASLPVIWGPDERGIVKLGHKMRGENFYAEDSHGVSFCVNATSRINKNSKCEKINTLFDLGFENPKILEGFFLLIEAKHKAEQSNKFDWMAATCRYDLQPLEIQRSIDKIISTVSASTAIVSQPKLIDQIETSINSKPDLIITDDVSFTVAPAGSESSKVSIQNAFLSQILRAVAKEHNVHISQVAAACVKYCIANDSILFRMKFNTQSPVQAK